MGELQVSGTTRLCGVIGDPIAHTLSPDIQNMLAAAMGVDLVYVPMHVRPEGLAEAIAGAYALDVLGLNVTVPHKQAVMQHLCGLDADAARIGAVNTLVRTENGYKGFNTDWLGLKRALSEERIDLNNRHVLLLGAGGAANAVAYLCGYVGAKTVTILNRTLQTAQTLADKQQALFSDTRFTPMELDAYAGLERTDYICIQTTSCGMHPNSDKAPICDPAFYEKLSAVVDIVFKPVVTRFMTLADAAGVPNCNGLMMLLYQAVEAFALFTGVHPTPEAVAETKQMLVRRFREECA